MIQVNAKINHQMHLSYWQVQIQTQPESNSKWESLIWTQGYNFYLKIQSKVRIHGLVYRRQVFLNVLTVFLTQLFITLAMSSTKFVYFSEVYIEV